MKDEIPHLTAMHEVVKILYKEKRVCKAEIVMKARRTWQTVDKCMLALKSARYIVPCGGNSQKTIFELSDDGKIFAGFLLKLYNNL